MKNILCAIAAMMFFAGSQSAVLAATPGTSTHASVGVSATAQTPGLYAVAQKFFAENSTPVADVMVTSEKGLQLVTVTAASGTCRAVLSDADGQILRTRAVDGEVEFDFYGLPTGTYRLAILDGNGALHLQQTLVKR